MTREDFKPMIDLIYENYNDKDCWTVERLGGWLGWAADRGFLIEALDDKSGDTIGVAVIRPVSEIPGNDDFYGYDIRGDIMHIDLCVAPELETRRELAQAMLELMGERPFIALRHRGKAKLHKTDKAMKALRIR